MEGFLRLKGARDLSRRELAILREVANWRDTVAAQLDRATFRVMGNETLFELARRAPRNHTELSSIKGMPKGMIERAAPDIIAAILRGMEAPEAELPKFPRGLRWNKDRDFDDRVARLKSVRDAAATRLELDPGVLCSRERLENIARSDAKSVEDLASVPDLRRWQIEEMGEGFIRALQSQAA
jgi:ribonuclease D